MPTAIAVRALPAAHCTHTYTHTHTHTHVRAHELALVLWQSAHTRTYICRVHIASCCPPSPAFTGTLHVCAGARTQDQQRQAERREAERQVLHAAKGVEPPSTHCQAAYVNDAAAPSLPRRVHAF